jgi:hypothetical protein
VQARDVHEMRRFIAIERVNGRLRFVASAFHVLREFAVFYDYARPPTKAGHIGL